MIEINAVPLATISIGIMAGLLFWITANLPELNGPDFNYPDDFPRFDQDGMQLDEGEME